MNSGDDIRQKIKGVLVDTLELNLTGDEIEESASLDQLLGFDSVAAIEFVVGLEKAFDITIESEFLELEVLADLDRLSTYIDGRISKASSR
ncbi:MAG: acyl carrier protein [Deltaproteobacteria bacterium]|nr:acyl carrier protein [Deltaproteobacteria bacterium]